MATIRNRGEYQWEAQIRRKGYPAQCKTFETKADAQAWARMIESEIDRDIFVSRVEAERTAFHQLIDRYISEIAPKHKGAYSEIKRLEALSVIRSRRLDPVEEQYILSALELCERRADGTYADASHNPWIRSPQTPSSPSHRV